MPNGRLSRARHHYHFRVGVMRDLNREKREVYLGAQGRIGVASSDNG